MEDIQRPTKQINRNLMQLLVRMGHQKTKIVEGGRGVGKSTVLADEMEDIAHDMPRSTNFLQAVSFQQALTRTLPSTIQSLSTLGYVKDLHYFVGRKPPKTWKWDEPYEPPLDWGKAIYWYTGAVWLLLSQDVSSRGLNTASGMSDEFCLLNPVKFQAEAIATLRGQKERFKDKRRYLSQTYVSSIPRTQEGKFIYSFEEESKKNPERILFLRASSFVNKENLPEDWFENQRRSMTKHEYDIEIKNIRPRAINGGFYPLFSESALTYNGFNNDYLRGIIENKNGYDPAAFNDLDCRQDADLRPLEALDIALDYGKFNCIVTAQEADNTCRFLSSLTVESPKLTKDLCDKWCTYYQHHTGRVVHYWYDATATGKDGRSPKTYKEIVVETLSSYGWTVIEHYYGTPAGHNDKYIFWSIAMRNDDYNLPMFLWNKGNCKYLIESINNSAAKQGPNGIEKIKTDERKDHIDQRYTTHQGDAMDMLGYYKYAHRLESAPIFIPTRIH